MVLNSQNLNDNTTIPMIPGEELFLTMPLLGMLNKRIPETLLWERRSERIRIETGFLGNRQ